MASTTIKLKDGATEGPSFVSDSLNVSEMIRTLSTPPIISDGTSPTAT